MGQSVHNIQEEDIKQAAKIEFETQEKKQVAITFDDGPDPVYTPELLEGLKKRNVRATFFLLGKQVEQYPDIVKQMYEEGHVVGCHSYEHVDLSHMSEEDACEQIKQICDLIYEITGERPSFVRPPYGEWLPCLDEDFCMIPVLWDVDPLDWATKDARPVSYTHLDVYKRQLFHRRGTGHSHAQFPTPSGALPHL